MAARATLFIALLSAVHSARPRAAVTRPRGAVTRRAACLSAGALLVGRPQNCAAASAEATEPPLAYFRFASTSPVWTTEASVAAAPQRIYNPKFVAYLARLLLNFDRASQSWWQDQTNRPFVASGTLRDDPELQRKQAEDFQKLQASISLGLRGFQGPTGVSRLFELLRARFGGTEFGDRQVALLFSLMGEGQPTKQISELVAATDNARVARFIVDDGGSGYDPAKPPLVSVTAGAASFQSDEVATGKAVLAPTGRVLRLRVADGGAGYAGPPVVTIAPPARGGRRAAGVATVRDGAVESIQLVDAGEGYTAADEPLRVELGAPEETPEDGGAAPSWFGLSAVEATSQRRRSGFEGSSAPGRSVGTARYLTSREQLETSGRLETAGRRRATATVTLDYGVSSIEVVSGGRGYGLDLPVQVAIARPPKDKKKKGGKGGVDESPLTAPRTAKASVELASPLAGRRLTAWLPAVARTFAYTDLLPSTLVPQLDACLGRFTVSPVAQQQRDWCIYFEDEWAAGAHTVPDRPRHARPVLTDRPALCVAQVGGGQGLEALDILQPARRRRIQLAD